MEFSELIQKRQSDRKYKDEPVRKEDIVKCLEAARLAPSACNSQPWKFVVVEDKAALKEMSEAAIGLGMNKFTAGAQAEVPPKYNLPRQETPFPLFIPPLF